MGSLGDIDPAEISCARNEDSERLIRMDAARPQDWSDRDIDLTIWRATTTIMSEKIVPRILPEFLRRAIREPDAGWMTSSDVVRQKLEASRFSTWAIADREDVLILLPAYIATLATDFESLAEWLEVFNRKDA